jgi:hypothetical protein
MSFLVVSEIEQTAEHMNPKRVSPHNYFTDVPCGSCPGKKTFPRMNMIYRRRVREGGGGDFGHANLAFILISVNCTVFALCGEGNEISPSGCVYYSEWLKLPPDEDMF